MKPFHRLVSLSACLTTAVAASAQAPDHSPPSFSIQYTNCVESIGVGLALTDAARALVPPQFSLAGEGQPFTPLVVRTSRCAGISVEHQPARPGVLVQVGAVIAPPDGTGDIDMYTLFQYTSSLPLSKALKRAGLRVQLAPKLEFDYAPTKPGTRTPFFASVALPSWPSFSLQGVVNEAEEVTGSFDANWWATRRGARVKLATHVPELKVGAAALALATYAEGPLGRLFGTGAITFAALEQWNAFAAAETLVQDVP